MLAVQMKKQSAEKVCDKGEVEPYWLQLDVTRNVKRALAHSQNGDRTQNIEPGSIAVKLFAKSQMVDPKFASWMMSMLHSGKPNG